LLHSALACVIDGRYGLSGAQEPDTFLEALERAVAEKAGS
jgi:predicted DsbA family dithiol-disulfide isomerase